MSWLCRSSIVWICYLLILWLGSVNGEESLQRTNTNLILFRKCDAAMSLCNRSNCSKVRLTLSFLNAIFHFRTCFSLLPLKHSTSSFNIALILNQLLKIVAWLSDGTNESVRSSWRTTCYRDKCCCSLRFFF